MELYYIRHGQSNNNALWDRTGSSKGRSEDPELTAIGQQQAETLAAFLSRPRPPAPIGKNDPHNFYGFGLTHLYTSLMVRAIATALPTARALKLPIEAWPDLHEVGGIFLEDETGQQRNGLPGKQRAFFQETYPDLMLPQSVGEAGWWNREAESDEEGMLRARRFLGELLEKHGRNSGDRVAIFSHGAFYNHFIRAILGLEWDSSIWFAMNNVAITRIVFNASDTIVLYTNRTDFLPQELIT